LLEHPVGLARLRRRKADVVHLQWLSAPELDDRLLRVDAPLVFTAHDILPRRTAGKRDLWQRLFGRFAGIVVHSERARDQLAELVDPARLHVIPHPVFPSNPDRRDDGRTLLSLGIIREYKGLGDAIEATNRIDGARLLVAGDPLESIDGYRAAAGDRAEWRLGYLSDEEIERALGDATVALFPYRPEIDQSGALLLALGAGVPVVAYDVGGLGEPVRRFEAGRVVPAGGGDAVSAGARELLDHPAPLKQVRAGARRARRELAWVGAPPAHLAVYRELL